MSAHVDVLAVMAGATTEFESRAGRNHPDHAPYQVTAEMAESARATFLRMESELREARTAMAELIEADIELNAAFDERESHYQAGRAIDGRINAAAARRRAALARVKGGSE